MSGNGNRCKLDWVFVRPGVGMDLETGLDHDAGAPDDAYGPAAAIPDVVTYQLTTSEQQYMTCI